MSGPLAGFRVIELAGLGPTPFAGMLLSDLGADVVRVDRADGVRSPLVVAPERDVLARGRRSICVDLKCLAGVELVLQLVERADVLLEGYRPGTTERLGLGPQHCWERNHRLVYGRMTGWGQTGRWAQQPGHDINYLAAAGVLHHLRRAGQSPVPPLNLVADMGGGGLLMAFGITSALLQVGKSGRGQIVDAAMVDGAAILMSAFWGLHAMRQFEADPGENTVDTGSHFYDVYETKDGRYVAVGAVEPAFYRDLCAITGLVFNESEPLAHFDPDVWVSKKAELAAIIKTRTMSEWAELSEGTSACMTPVLSMEEAAIHPHNQDRASFIEIDSVVQPAPAPRFSGTPNRSPAPPMASGENSSEILSEWLDMTEATQDALRATGALGQKTH